MLVITYSRPTRQRQHGATLVISLIFLVLLTLVGVTAMQSTILQERMAGNSRERNIAFQAGEIGLRDAEVFLVGKSVWDFTSACTGGKCAQGSMPSWSTYAWDGSKDVLAGTTVPSVGGQPRYFAEYAGQVKCATCSGGWTTVYRSRTRSVGINTTTQVFLESAFRP